MSLRLKKLVVLSAAMLAGHAAYGALMVAPIDGTTVTADTMASALLGSSSGITINSATYTGANQASGQFTGGNAIIGFGSGILLTSGNVTNVVGPNSSDGATGDNGLSGNSSLDALIPGFTTHDASVLTINFTVPTAAKVTFNYVFGSEEYNEYVNSSYNDVFGFFVNGANAALIPGTATAVAINNLNCGNPFVGSGPNCALFRNNDLEDGGGAIDTELDGLTTVLSISASVNAGENELVLAIADAGDWVLDSGVFIQGESFQVCGVPGAPECPNGAPEPGVLALLSAGLLGLGLLRRRRR
jgi:hypothetical protein